ncbi:hypothetical protein KA005_62135 [bacterium]|nr:hypothetical protein [bacterium]
MADKQIIFYPVENGASALLKLDEETHILFDLNQFDEETREEKNCWDVHGSLIEELPNIDGRRHLSVLCVTHADKDHCRGLDKVFYLPGQNKDDEEMIHIDELWVTAEIFSEDVEDEGEMLQKETKRRLDLAANPNSARQAQELGNRLVVFGRRDDLTDLNKLPREQRPTAGEIVSTVAGEQRDDFEAFVHCPFMVDIGDENVSRNDKSLILQVRIKSDGGVWNEILMGGDANCSVWGTVYEETQRHKNMERLSWDIFMIPHHGSYRFFSEESREEARDNPDERSMAILDKGKEGGWLICSSRPIKSNNYEDDNPPHIQAINHYRKIEKEKKGKFVCLMEEPNKDEPKPYVLRFTDGGPQKRYVTATVATSVAVAAAKTTPEYGE